MSEYTDQAIKFLSDTNTDMTIDFKKWGIYKVFNDNETRGIYKITLWNDKGSYSFKYGDSVANFKSNTAPTEYDILCCLDGVIYDSFTEFCDSFGYDTDSRSAHKIYKAVNKQAKQLNILFTQDQLDQLSEVQ